MLKLIMFISSLLITLVTPASISFTANRKYSFVGRSTINIPSLILNKGQTNWLTYPARVIITFDRPIQASDGMRSFATIADLQMQNLYKGIEIFIYEYNNITQTQMTMDIYAGNANNIKKINIFYMYFYKDNEYFTNLQLYQKDYHFNNGLGSAISSNPSTTFYLTLIVSPQINITGGAKVIPYISGMHVAPSSSSILTQDISIVGLSINSTAILLIFSSKSSAYTYVYQFFIKIIVYNPSFLNSNASNYIHISSGTITSSQFKSKNFELTQFNTIIGLTSFSISNSSFFNFYSFVKMTEEITINSTLNSYVFTYMIIYSNYCDYKTPYYEQVTEQCWDHCPGQTTPNNDSLTCLCLINSTLTNNSNCFLTTNIDQSSSNDSTPKIIGIVIGIVVAVLTAGAVYYFVFVKRCCKKQQNQIKKQIQIQKGEKNNDDTICGVHKAHQNVCSDRNKKANEAQFEFQKQNNQIIVQKQVVEITDEDIQVEVKKPQFYPHLGMLQKTKL